MKNLVVFYIATNTTQMLPMILIALTLTFGIPYNIISFILRRRARGNRGLRNIGMARLEQFLEILNSGAFLYLTRFYQLACGIHFTNMTFIVLAIMYDLPLPFKPNLENPLQQGTMYEMMVFSLGTSFLQSVPVAIVGLVVVFGVELPHMIKTPETRAQSGTEITRWEQQSQEYALIRLSRLANSNEIIFFAHCRNDRSGEIFKVLLYQERGARSEFFVYTDDDQTLEQVFPAPINVCEVEGMFSLDDE